MSRGARLHQLVSAAALRDGEGEGRRLLVWGGAVVALLVAAVLFSRFSIDDTLSRDESIYAYGGQQLADGVPVYASIFDPKTPLAAMIAGLGVTIGRGVGADDVHAIRVVFFVSACLAAVAVYLLALWLFESVPAGLVAAATFASFKGFALDALTGPDAKTPGIFFAVLSMALLARRRYFWGAFAGSLAFLVWQPLIVYAAVAIAAALLTPNPERWWKRSRPAFAGALLPVAATTVYFWLAGALSDLVDAAFRYPLTGVVRAHETFLDRFERILGTVNRDYGSTRVLFWGGLLLLLGLFCLRLVERRAGVWRAVREDPYLNVVIPSFVFVAAFSALDFQGYPDLYPALPYAAIGVGGGFALVLNRLADPKLLRAGAAGSLAAVGALVALAWVSYSNDRPRDAGLPKQRADGARLEQLLAPDETLYALGNPMPLVLTGRRNPSPYIYLSAGVDKWKVDHTPGGFDGWTAEIRAEDPAIVVLAPAHGSRSVGRWHSQYAREMRAWLASHYRLLRVGLLLTFVKLS
jgi:hypothetical protein